MSAIPYTCDGCYHCIKKDTCSIPSNDQECAICIRNPSNLSRRDLEREIEIDGTKFKAPLDMYISHDRMKFEDFMRTKKIIEAIEQARRDRVPQWPDPKTNIPDPWKPWVPPQPYYPYVPTYPVYWQKWKVTYTRNDK